MKKNIFKTIALTLLISSVFSIPAFAESSLTKTSTFFSENKNDEIKLEKEIKENGKKYILKDITYKVVEEPKLISENETKNIDEDFPETIKKEVNGKTYTLKLDKKSIKKEKKDKVLKEYTVRARTTNELPNTYTFNIDGQDVSAKLTDYKVSNDYNIPFTVYAEYVGERDAIDVNILGTIYPLSTVTPAFSGYETILKNHLGLDNTYNITGSSWTSERADGSRILKTAQYTGTQLVRDYIGTYETEEGTEKVAIYTNKGTEEAKYKIEAKAIYTEKTDNKLLYIGGIALILLLAGGFIFALLGKKKKKEE